MRIPKDLRQHYEQACKLGWTFRISNDHHLLWYNPDGRTACTRASAAGKKVSDRRTLRNEISQLKRAGLNVD